MIRFDIDICDECVKADACHYCAGVNIGPTFAHRYALLCIHIWFLLVRLRAEGEEGKDIAQMIYENFQEDVEGMVRREGVVVCHVAALTRYRASQRQAGILIADCARCTCMLCSMGISAEAAVKWLL